MEAIRILSEGNFLALCIVILVLYWVGQQAVARLESARAWGWRLALATFSLYLVSAVLLHGISDAEQLASSCSHALLAGGLALGTSWIVLAISQFAWRELIGTPIRSIQRAREQRQRDAERERASERSRLAQRERETREIEERQQKLTADEQKQISNQRRQDARFACEWLYDRHRVSLADKFPQRRLDEYFQRYLGDNHPPEEVERRAEQLQAMLRELLDHETNGRKPRFDSIAELNADFDRQRQDLLGSPMDGERVSNLLAYLERERERAIREFNKR